MADVLWQDSDNFIEVLGVTNAATKAKIASATVTVTCVDSAGVEVTGQTWPLTLAAVAGADGDYRGTLQDTADFVRGKRYKAKVTINAGPDLQRYFEKSLQCRVASDK